MTEPSPSPPGPSSSSSNRQRMVAGEWYITDEEILTLQRNRAAVMGAYNSCPPDDESRRQAMLVELFGVVGADVEVRAPVYVDYGTNVTLGAWTFLNYGCQLADVAPIRIGEAVQIGPNVQLLTPIRPDRARAAAGPLGAGSTDRDRRQRLGRRRGDRAAGCQHRGGLRDRSRGSRHQGRARRRTCRRQPGARGAQRAVRSGRHVTGPDLDGTA